MSFNFRSAKPQWINTLKSAWLSIFVLAAIVLRFLWIKNIPYILDEPLLIDKALSLNAEGQWADKGLMGVKGVYYGALPTWIYQALIPWMDNPIQLALTKNFLITLMTTLGLAIWVGIEKRKEKYFLWLAFLSPMLWFYSRDLWDNSWLTGFSILLWSCYLWFDHFPTPSKFLIFCFLGALSFLIHLMVLPLLGAIAILFIYKHGRFIKQYWLIVGMAVLGIVFIDGKYASELFLMKTATPEGAWSVKSLGFFLRAPTYFSSFDFTYFLGKGWAQDIWNLPVFLSLFSFLYFFLGLWSSVWITVQNFKKKSSSPANDLALLCLIFFIGLSFVKGLSHHLHYFSGIWPVAFYFIWRGMFFTENAYFNVWRLVWAFALVFSLMGIQSKVQEGSGSRNVHYGPALEELWRVSGELEEGHWNVSEEVENKAFIQGAVQSLMHWRGVKQQSKGQAKTRLGYLKPQDTSSAALVSY